jgi:hypothetical protein
VDPLPSFTCDLRHGLKLTLAQPVEHVPIYAFTDLLAAAVNHFTDQQHVQKVAIYRVGPYVAVVEHRGMMVTRLEISHPGDENKDFLSTAKWTDAVIESLRLRQFCSPDCSTEIGLQESHCENQRTRVGAGDSQAYRQARRRSSSGGAEDRRKAYKADFIAHLRRTSCNR